MPKLPRPCDMGAPERFVAWRPEQADAWLRFTESDYRFSGTDLPTGGGKSLLAWMCAQYADTRSEDRPPRALFLTSTKGLQTQYREQFPFADVRGQNNYPCVAVLRGGPLQEFGESRPTMVDKAPCHVGVHCRLKTAGGCEYYDAVSHAAHASMVITNYSYWLALGKMQRLTRDAGEPLGGFDLLVLDEAHAAMNEACAALRIELQHYDLRVLLSAHPLEVGAPLAEWRGWGKDMLTRCGAKMDEYLRAVRQDPDLIDQELVAELKGLRQLSSTLNMLSTLEGDWVVGVSRKGNATTFDPVWPAAYCEQLLYRGVPRVLMVSATIRPKTLRLLGVDAAASDFWEYPSSFPVKRRPVYVCPMVPRVDKNMKEGSYEEQLWVTRIDQIIEGRLDRKGIIHTVSYARAARLRALSKFGHLMITHDTASAQVAIKAFKHAAAPAILVSPSVTTGEDFPFDECEYTIIAKLPFTDMRDPIMRRREQTDREWGGYAMMQTLVQSAGRGMRDAADMCETFICDDHASWVFSRSGKRSLRHLAPRWFLDALQWPDAIPAAPPLVRAA